NPAGTNGLIAGNSGFFFKQIFAVVFSSIWAFGLTYGMLWLINKITPVRVSESDEAVLDESLHGEIAYTELG
ncbi:MAG: ammonium transporter, partial [Armatimonadota bacterium]